MNSGFVCFRLCVHIHFPASNQKLRQIVQQVVLLRAMRPSFRETPAVCSYSLFIWTSAQKTSVWPETHLMQPNRGKGARCPPEVLGAPATRGLARSSRGKKFLQQAATVEVHRHIGFRHIEGNTGVIRIKHINRKGLQSFRHRKAPKQKPGFWFKIISKIIKSGLCSWHKATGSLTFGWESANSSSSSGLRAGWFQEANAMGFVWPTAPLSPGWVSSVLCAFACDRNEAGCYMHALKQ